jgi:GT2 family glycosyltransferase
MKLSIIIVSYNTKELLQQCLESIADSLRNQVQSSKLKVKNNQLSLANTEVIIVDNNSTDGSQEYLAKLKAQNSKFKTETQSLKPKNKSGKKLPNIKIILNKENAGFSKANNQGIEKARGKYILLLNSDTIMTEKNFFTEAINFLAENKKIGVLGPKLLWENGQAQPSGGYFPTLPRLSTWALMLDDLPLVNKIIKPYHPHQPSFYTKDLYYQKNHYQDWVTGACFFIKRAVIDKIGFLDENIFMYTEEMEYCYRAKKAGFKVVYYPKISLVHLGGKSGTSLLAAKNEFWGIKYFYQKHQPLWQKPIANFLLKTAATLRKFVFRHDQEKSQVYQQVLASL